MRRRTHRRPAGSTVLGRIDARPDSSGLLLSVSRGSAEPWLAAPDLTTMRTSTLRGAAGSSDAVPAY
jgi:hypothetical protein